LLYPGLLSPLYQTEYTIGFFKKYLLKIFRLLFLSLSSISRYSLLVVFSLWKGREKGKGKEEGKGKRKMQIFLLLVYLLIESI